MSSKNFKLIGLVAVLVLMMALPGVTQEFSLTRENVVNALNNVLQATLTAAEEDFFNVEKAFFFSHPEATMAVISCHSASRCWQQFRNLIAGEEVGAVTLGMLYLSNPISVNIINYWPIEPEVPIRISAGLYKLQATSKDKVAIVDKEGNIVASGPMEILGPTEAGHVGAKIKMRVGGHSITIEITITDENAIVIRIY